MQVGVRRLTVESFRRTKNQVDRSTSIGLPRLVKALHLQTDASRQGPGAVLTQGENNNERVIAYASHSLNKAEKIIRRWNSNVSRFDGVYGRCAITFRATTSSS